MNSETPVLDAHRSYLVDSLVEHIVALKPEDVLDVGCGDGLLLEELEKRNIVARGVDPSQRQLERARARGADVSEADARELPFDDGTFDWVVIRHVLHHLDEPEVAVREAWRVARSGVILSEPFADPSIESQREMARFDELTTMLLGRGGHVHHPYSSAGDLISFVPDPVGLVDTRTYGRMSLVPEHEARRLVANAAHGSELNEDDLARVEEIAAAAAAGRITYNSSVLVIVRRA